MKLFQKRTIALAAALTVFCTGSTSFPVTAAEALRGDPDGDGTVTVMDAQIALNAATEVIIGNPHGLSETAAKAVDADLDTKITVADAQLILLHYVYNIVTEIPTDWDALTAPKRPENIVPDTDDKLRILAWAGDDAEQMITHFEEANPLYKGKLEYCNVGIYSMEAMEQYAAYFAGGEDADLFLTDQDWIRSYTDDDRFTRPITDLGFSESDFDKCYPYTLTIGRNSSGELRAVTWEATPGGYVYRTDLAQKYLGVSSPEEMQPFVADWKAFINTAEKVKKVSGGKTAMAATLRGLAQPWIYGRHDAWLDAQNKLTISQEAKDFYDIISVCKQNGYTTQADQWSDSWYEVGQDDSAMGYFFCTWCLEKHTMLYNAEGGDSGKTYGKYNITEGPAAWRWGGEYLTLARKCNSGTIAHDFIDYFIVTSGTMLDYAKKTGTFVNNSEVMQDMEIPNPLLGGQSEIAVLHRNAMQLDLSKTYSDYDDDLSYSFIDSAIHYSTVEEAIENFKHEAAKMEFVYVE